VFIDRREAGRQLAGRLEALRSQQPVIFALPRGGMPVAVQIARRLNAPIDVVLVRKLGAPMQPELALGAIVDGDQPTITLNDDVVRQLGVTSAEINEIAAAELAEIDSRRQLYFGSLRRISPHGRTVIVVDDGIATGATARAAARALRKRGAARLILAVPVAPLEAIDSLAAELDQIVCLQTPKNFTSVGAYYKDFQQVSTAEVIKILAEFANGKDTLQRRQ
jgi:putative phosphoribosyl transferase